MQPNRMLPIPTTLLAAALLATLAPPASSCDGDGQGDKALRGRPHAAERGQALASRLELTPEQRTSFEEISSRTREALQPLHEQLRDRLRTLRSSEDGFDRQALRDDSQIQSLRQQIQEIRAEQRSQLQEILTAEQLQELEELRARREERRDPPRRRRPGSERNPRGGSF